MASLTSSLNPVHGEGDGGGAGRLAEPAAESATLVPLPDYFGAFATKLLRTEGDAEAGGKARRLKWFGRVVRATLIVPPALLLLGLPGALSDGDVSGIAFFGGIPFWLLVPALAAFRDLCAALGPGGNLELLGGSIAAPCVPAAAVDALRLVERLIRCMALAVGGPLAAGYIGFLVMGVMLIDVPIGAFIAALTVWPTSRSGWA